MWPIENAEEEELQKLSSSKEKNDNHLEFNHSVNMFEMDQFDT